MARFDRCSVCDYTESGGSSQLNVKAGRHGKVRRYGDDQLCDTCIREIGTNLVDLSMDDEDG